MVLFTNQFCHVVDSEDALIAQVVQNLQQNCADLFVMKFDMDNLKPGEGHRLLFINTPHRRSL